jgi:hypothetical protein
MNRQQSSTGSQNQNGADNRTSAVSMLGVVHPASSLHCIQRYTLVSLTMCATELCPTKLMAHQQYLRRCVDPLASFGTSTWDQLFPRTTSATAKTRTPLVSPLSFGSTPKPPVPRSYHFAEAWDASGCTTASYIVVSEMRLLDLVDTSRHQVRCRAAANIGCDQYRPRHRGHFFGVNWILSLSHFDDLDGRCACLPGRPNFWASFDNVTINVNLVFGLFIGGTPA